MLTDNDNIFHRMKQKCRSLKKDPSRKRVGCMSNLGLKRPSSWMHKCWRILLVSKFWPVTWKCHQTTTKCCMPHQRDTSPCWFWHHHGKIQTGLSSTSMVKWPLAYSWSQSGQSAIHSCSSLLNASCGPELEVPLQQTTAAVLLTFCHWQTA